MTSVWAEITDSSQSWRFQALSQAMTEAGFANELEVITASKENFDTLVREAQSRVGQIRVSGALCELAPHVAEQMPSQLLSLKSADAIVKTDESWWPRNFLVDGLGRALIRDLKTLELSGAVFILGANCEARAIVASLAKIGFSRFTLSDPDDVRGQALVDSFRSTYFGVQFQFIPSQSITQLPSVHTFAVNTLGIGADSGSLGELFYFNFLKPGGVWLDLALTGSVELENEAKAVGSIIESGFNVIAWTDRLWALEALGVDLDAKTLAARYQTALGSA